MEPLLGTHKSEFSQSSLQQCVALSIRHDEAPTRRGSRQESLHSVDHASFIRAFNRNLLLLAFVDTRIASKRARSQHDTLWCRRSSEQRAGPVCGAASALSQREHGRGNRAIAWSSDSSAGGSNSGPACRRGGPCAWSSRAPWVLAAAAHEAAVAAAAAQANRFTAHPIPAGQVAAICLLQVRSIRSHGAATFRSYTFVMLLS